MWQLVIAWMLIAGAALTAHAANVNLTAAVNAPTAATLVPFTYTVTFGNSTTPSTTAVNAPISVGLSADLYDISIVSAVGTGGADCSTAATFAGVPAAGVLTSGSEVMTASIASLPTNAECTITIAATALRAKTYPLRAVIQPGPGDSLSGSANDSFGNTVVSPSTLHLAVNKSVLGPTPIAAGGVGTEPYGTVTYQIVYANNSPIDIPMDLVGDIFYDSESAQADTYPTTQAVTILNCIATGGTICPSLTPVGTSFDSVGRTTPLQISNPGGSGGVFKANSTITITYKRPYTAPVCSAVSITNSAVWGTNSSYGNIVWDSTGGGSDSSRVSFALTPDAPACLPLAIAPTVTKVLDNITNSVGAVKTATAPFNITADGDTAHYTVTLHGDPGRSVKFSFADGFWAPNGHPPTFVPNGSVLQTATVDSCTITGAGSGVCPPGIPSYPYALPGETATTDFNTYLTDSVQLDAGQAMVLKMSYKYAISGATCNAVAGEMLNAFSFSAVEPPSGFVYTGSSSNVWADTSATPLHILPALDRCVDMTANKQVSTVSPLAGAPFTFTLDYTNSTSATTGNTVNPPDPLTNVAITDTLGAAFTPSAISCTVVSGVATAPGVSLADITGANHTFNAVIPSIADAAIVRCIVTGSTSLPGTYTNLTRTTVTTPGMVDAKPSNDTSQVNYGVVGTQVLLTQTVSPTGQVAPGSTLVYTVTAVAGGRAADGTVVQDNLPAEIQSFSWTCSASGGAVCPAVSSGTAGAGGAPLNESIATFPVGSSVVYTITAIVKATPPTTTVTNTASALLPPNASCLPNSSASPCTAQVSNSLPAAGPGPEPGGGTGTGAGAGGGGSGGVTSVPIGTPWMLCVLGLALSALGVRRLRQG